MRSTIKTSWLTNRIVRNILFWLIFTLYHYLGVHRPWHHFPALLFVMFLSFGIPAYINNLKLIPSFLLRRKYVHYLLWSILLLLATAVLSFYLTHLFNSLVPSLHYMGAQESVPMMAHIFPSVVFLALLAFGKFTADSINNQHAMEQLATEKLESELAGLKSQINPHFLFNALNTVYGLARRTDDDETADATMKLSDIMRYVLYECDVPVISLRKEIRFLKQYTLFAGLRYNKDQSISLKAEGDFLNYNIAPLLLLPFLENAFKHGLGSRPDGWLQLTIAVDNGRLYFHCANNYSVKPRIDINKGLGLNGVRRRLELLYPKRHELLIEVEKETYEVTLNIRL